MKVKKIAAAQVSVFERISKAYFKYTGSNESFLEKILGIFQVNDEYFAITANPLHSLRGSSYSTYLAGKAGITELKRGK